MGSGRRRWLLLSRSLVGLAVLVVALGVFGDAARRSHFDPDETLYMWRGRYFGLLFLRHDVTSPEWGDNYWTHTQPMLTNFVVGGWLWTRGYDLDRLPPPYDWGVKGKQNRREGRVPDQATLATLRAPMIAIAASGAVLLYLLGSALGGSLAGLTGAAILIASPLSQKFLVRALAEPPLTFFLLLGLLVGFVGARRGGGQLPAGWAIATGVALGLAFATKLTALLGLLAVASWGAIAVVLAWSRASGGQGAGPRAGWAAGRGWALALVVALGTFVLSDPHLYPNPVEHTRHLFEHRADEMRAQQEKLPAEALHNPLDRPGFVLGGSLVDSPPLGARRVPLEAGLAAVGIVALAIRTARGWRRTWLPAEGLVVLTALAYFAGVSAGMLLAWPHYLIPTFVLGALLSGVGLAAVARRLGRIGGDVWKRLGAAARRRRRAEEALALGRG